MKKKYVKPRHKFFYWFLTPVAKIIAKKFHFKTKRFKTKKDENYLILSNHQSNLEPVLMALTFRKPIYFVASDVIYTKKWYSKLLFWCFAPIKKRKGVADVACIRSMCQVAKEGGNVAIFPEGNRQWNDSQFYIDAAIVKLIRVIRLPVVIYNFHGGYGVNPRWGNRLRKGKHVGEINRIITLEEQAKMSDEELYKVVIDGLKVIDSNSGELYKSNKRAEYLERLLFICPKCHSYSTLHSHGNFLTCSSCGLKVEHQENLLLKSDDKDFKFNKVIDWCDFQIEEVKKHKIEKDEVIVKDDYAELFDKTTQNRIKLSSGRLVLTQDKLMVGDFEIPTSQIYGAGAQDGNKFLFCVGDKSYLIIGDERFNSIKYILFFNRVCKLIENKGGDKYYALNIDNARR